MLKMFYNRKEKGQNWGYSYIQFGEENKEMFTVRMKAFQQSLIHLYWNEWKPKKEKGQFS